MRRAQSFFVQRNQAWLFVGSWPVIQALNLDPCIDQRMSKNMRWDPITMRYWRLYDRDWVEM